MKNITKNLINITSTTMTAIALVGALALSTPAKADAGDAVKVIGVIILMDQLFNNNRNDRRDNRNDNRNYDDRYYNGQQQGGYNGNGQVYDDRGVYNRTCNDNLGCAPRDNNRWNEPRKHGYADGRNRNGRPNGQVCGKRVEHFQNYSETLHLDCSGNVMYVTRHQK